MDNKAFFKNGTLYDVYPRNTNISLYEDRDVAYNARYIVSDGVTYDLTNYDDLATLKVPDFSNSDSSAFSLDYILRMCASNYRNRGQNHLSIAILAIATRLMIYSKIGWSIKDFKRIVYWLIEDGRNEEAKEWEQVIDHNKEIQAKANIDIICKNNFSTLIDENDLVCFNSSSRIVCQTCAIYTGRVYSISGKNKLFPKLPDMFKGSVSYHTLCRSSFAPCLYSDPDTEQITYKGKRISIRQSIRSFIDTRTDEEISAYDDLTALEDIKKRRIKEQDKDYREYLADKAEYNRLKNSTNPPNDLPKSLAAYIRQKYGLEKQEKKITDDDIAILKLEFRLSVFYKSADLLVRFNEGLGLTEYCRWVLLAALNRIINSMNAPEYYQEIKERVTRYTANARIPKKYKERIENDMQIIMRLYQESQ